MFSSIDITKNLDSLPEMSRRVLCVLLCIACVSASTRRRVKPPDVRRRMAPGAPRWSVKGAPDTKKDHCGFRILPNDNVSMAAAEVYHATKEIGAYNHAVMIDWVSASS